MDIDLDLDPEIKPKIIERIRKELGETNVLYIATFGTEATRSALLSCCRGYRSEEYPNGIDIDTAQYMTSLIEQERGFLFSLKDSIYGNKEKGRKPNKTLISELDQFPGLKEAAIGIEGTIKQAGLHAAGIVFYNDDVYEYSAIMRAPNGELCTQMDLDAEEKCGNIKFDFLVTSICTKISQTIKLLQESDYIEKNLSLRQAYHKHLHPSVLDVEDERIWKAIANNEVVSLFQFDSPVGIKAARECKPSNIVELANVNSLLRLMSDGGESPMARYIRMKNDMTEWENEMVNYGLTDEEKNLVHPYYYPDYGTPAAQEVVMFALLDENLFGWPLKDVNKARKIIAKKKMSEIPSFKEKVYKSAKSKNVAEYIWKTLIEPQLGYSFSKLHSTAYSFVGVQTAVLATKWPAVYWNTANLIVDSGGTDGDGVDYGKIAKSIGTFTRSGLTVELPDINSSKGQFAPLEEKNTILYGLNAISGVSSSFVQQIIENRPYSSWEDFVAKNSPTITQMLGLIKAGCFDSLMDRKVVLNEYLSTTADLKKKLTLSNLPKLMEANLIPDELEMQRRIANFNAHLRKNMKTTIDKKVAYIIEGPYEVFFNDFLETSLLEHDGTKTYIEHKVWDKYYKTLIEPIKLYIATNQAEILEKFNKHLLDAQVLKYQSGHGTLAEMEIESCGFMSTNDHWLFELNYKKYGLSEFGDLPQIPTYDSSFIARNGREIKLAKIDKTIGVCIHRIPAKGLFYLLDADGVIEVKMPNQQFAQYDKQISEVGADNKKTVISKSVFTRGNALVVQGFREYNQFRAKKYARTPGHTISRIISVDENGKLEFDFSRDSI